jgi:bifunctional enzyme CysN/CysC
MPSPADVPVDVHSAAAEEAYDLASPASTSSRSRLPAWWTTARGTLIGRLLNASKAVSDDQYEAAQPASKGD